MATRNAPPSPLNEYVHALLTDAAPATDEQKIVMGRLRELHAKRTALHRELEAMRASVEEVEEGLANLEGAIQISAEILHELNPATRAAPPQPPHLARASFDDDLGKRD